MNGIAITEFHLFHKRTLRFSGCKFIYDSPSVTQVSSILFKRIVKINFLANLTSLFVELRISWIYANHQHFPNESLLTWECLFRVSVFLTEG